jgi:hypothetical protein
VTPVAATAQSFFAGDGRTAAHAIDGTGMTPNSPVTAISTCGTNPGGAMWLSNGVKNTWITFDLGSVQTLSGFHLWNYNEVNFTRRGVRTAAVYTGESLLADGTDYASAGAAWGTLVENYTFTEATSMWDYAGEDYTFPAPVTTQYIQIYISDNFPASDGYVGLSEVRFRTATPEADLVTFGLPGIPGVIDQAAKTIAWTLPLGTNLETLAPTYTMSSGASCDKASGSPQDFTNPVTYTVTSSDSALSTPYTVTATVSGWKFGAWTNDADSRISSLSAYTMAVNLNGPAATINGVPFQASALSGTNFSIGGEVANFNDGDYNVTGASAALAANMIYNGNPRMVTLINLTPGVTYETTFFSVGFERSGRLETFASAGDSFTLDQDFYGNNNGIWISHTFVADGSGSKVLTVAPVAGGAGTLHLYAVANRVAITAPQAEILTFGLPGLPTVIDDATKTISWTVPHGTDITTLAPTYTLSDGATCNKASGSPQNFTAPVTYTVTSQDEAITNDYTVTVTVSAWGYSPWTGDADSGIAETSNYNVAVNLNGGAATVNWVDFEASTFGGTNFSIGGAQSFYNNDPGVNITGDSAKLANDFVYNGNPRTVTLTHLTPGLTYETTFFSVGFDTSDRRQVFASGSDSLVVDQDLYGNNNGIRINYTFVADASGTKELTVTPTPGAAGTFHLYALANREVVTIPRANIFAFGLPGMAAVVDRAAQTIAWAVPYGTNVTSLAPEFTMSAGATSDKASGSTQNFTTPQTYTIKSSDSATTHVYTVTVTVLDLPVTGGLSVWLAADTINPRDASQSRIVGSDSFIKQWNDHSVNNLDATQAADASQPQYLAGDLNGLPSVKWDGSGKFLQGPSSSTNKTIFAVCKMDAAATTVDGMFCGSPSQDYWHIRGSATAWRAPGAAGTDAADAYDFPFGGRVDVNGASGNTHDGQWHVLMEESASSPAFTYQLGQTFASRFFNGRIAEFIIYNRTLTTDEMNAVGSYLTDKYALTTSYPALTPQAKMFALGTPGWPGAIDQTQKTIVLTVPYGTDLTSYAPTYTLSGGATSDKASGSPQNFSSPVTYTVTSSDTLDTTVYTVTATIATRSTAKDILTFGLPAIAAVIDGTHITLNVPLTADVTTLAPTYSVSSFASGSPASGSTVDFSTPQTYTVTAEDGSTMDYLVTVTPASWVVADGGFEKVRIGSFGYNPAGTAWTFNASSGLAANGSPWYGPAAPEGTQGGFLQAVGGSISQTLDFPAGDYAVSFAVVGRAGYGSRDLSVAIDGVSVYSLTVAEISTATWASHTTPVFTLDAGMHTLAFVTGAGGDADVIDRVEIIPMGGVVDPYATWLGAYPSLTGADALPGADPDGDGMTNQQEFAFGLNPTKGSSVNPVTVPLSKANHTFSYTRLAASDLSYTVWTSTDLQVWNGPAAVTETVGTPIDGVETVQVKLTSPPAGDKLFVRVQAQ